MRTLPLLFPFFFLLFLFRPVATSCTKQTVQVQHLLKAFLLNRVPACASVLHAPCHQDARMSALWTLLQEALWLEKALGTEPPLWWTQYGSCIQPVMFTSSVVNLPCVVSFVQIWIILRYEGTFLWWENVEGHTECFVWFTLFLIAYYCFDSLLM